MNPDGVTSHMAEEFMKKYGIKEDTAQAVTFGGTYFINTLGDIGGMMIKIQSLKGVKQQ